MSEKIRCWAIALFPNDQEKARRLLVKRRGKLIQLRDRLINGPHLPRDPLAEPNRLFNPTAQRVITLQMAIEEIEAEMEAMVRNHQDKLVNHLPSTAETR